MTTSMPTRRVHTAHGSAVAGYVIAAAINVALLIIVNITPGWQTLPVLTESTVQVLGLVNAAFLAAVAVNFVYLFYDPPWLTDAGDLLTSGIGLAALVRIWNVFPFALGDWATLARVGLGVAIAGTIIAMILQFAGLIKHLAHAAIERGQR